MELLTKEIMNETTNSMGKEITADKARKQVINAKKTGEFYWKILDYINLASRDGESSLTIEIDDDLGALRTDKIIEHLTKLGFRAELNYDNLKFEVSW